MLYNCLMEHLEQDDPETYKLFREWQLRTGNLLKKIRDLWRKWEETIHMAQHREKQKFESRTSPWPDDNTTEKFAKTIWESILMEHLLSVRNFFRIHCFSVKDYKLGKETSSGLLVLTFQKEEIATGKGEWIGQLQAFHTKLFNIHKNLLIGTMKEMDILEEIGKLEDLANEAFEELEMVYYGRTVFYPGHCRVCRALATGERATG